MHQIVIIGNLGADPDVRFTSSGGKVTTLRVASNQYCGGKEETFWWRVTVWGDQFDRIMPHFKRGSSIFITGRMPKKPEIYTDRDGRSQVSLDLVAHHISFVPLRRKDGNGDQFAQNDGEFPGQSSMQRGEQQGTGDQPKGEQEQQHDLSFEEEEIPF